MPVGLSRTEQYGLLGMVMLMVAGLAVREWRAGGGGGLTYADADGWEQIGVLEAGGRPSLDLDRLAPPPEQELVIDINTAGPIELERLPGIGPARASAILSLRERLGGFSSIEQLDDVHGIGPATLERLRPHLRLAEPAAPAETSGAADSREPPDEPPLEVPLPPAGATESFMPAGLLAPPPAPASVGDGMRININAADEQQLQQIKGIGPALARRIIEDRQANGPFRQPADLQRVKGIGPKTYEKMAPDIRVR